MSIKKLFGSIDSGRNYLSDRDQKDAFKDVESERNLEQLKEKQSKFVPQVDYSEPAYFAKFGSAHLYYKGAMQRITDYYPYDGSDAEINEFYNKLLDVEKYVFDNLYPRANGYINLGAATGDGYSPVAGYPVPTTKEYIEFKGGPHALSSDATLAQSINDPLSSKFQYANIYDTDIYTTAGLPSNYGQGTRQSNLQCNFDTGVTLEFWLKKPGWIASEPKAPEVIFDLWTSGSFSGSADYGRITLTVDPDPTYFVLSVQSGSNPDTGASLQSQQIGQNITNTLLRDWNHFAMVLYNTGSNFVSKLYLNGVLNDTNEEPTSSIGAFGQLKQKDTVARIGAYLTAPSGALDVLDAHLLDGASKLTGSIDEFRFWKEKRSAQDIGRHWFTQVRGGTNTDISNTTLGVYYKFNEGITGVSATDSTVLDYAGRITNGNWTGYGAASRVTSSAIIEASASTKEYKDPIIYSGHSDVLNLKTSLLDKGSWYDNQNNALFMNYAPSWVLEEHENSESSDLSIISHIVGAYFDRIYLLSQQIPRLKGPNYTSGSAQPIPFAQHLPQSLGLYMPEIFIDANVMEKFLNRNENSLFQDDLNETKNLIYLNLYNNLANIFKSKGTEKALRNVLRCFNIDEKIIKINTYARNTTFPLNNNYEQVIEQKTFGNFAKRANRTAVIYQADVGMSPNPAEASGYISSSTNTSPGAVNRMGAGGAINYERNYGATIEAEVMFPYWSDRDYVDDPRDYTTVSLFGMTTPFDGPTGLTGEDPRPATNNYANFTVRAIKPDKNSKDVYFELSSSRPHDAADATTYPFPTLTSSIFFDVYDNSTWNFSVRIKPKIDAPVLVLGSLGTIEEYDIVFEGRHVNLGSVENSFSLTGSVDVLPGSHFLQSHKRIYIGAQRTNLTGTLVHQSDVLISAARYWAKYLDNTSISHHGYDIDNYGISNSYQNVQPTVTYTGNTVENERTDILNLNTLALNWGFEQVTSSNTNGNLVVPDISSGSALLRDNYGMMGKITGYQHNGYGYGFQASDTAVVKKKHVNTFKFIEPERATSADAVQILSEDDKVFGLTQTVPNYVYTVEKSMYRAISEEMLDFFAGVVDFNNIIGEPVNRYRERYKSLEKLREAFFRKVTKTSQVEKFVEYYKWFDDAISIIMGQLVPASSDFVSDVYNTVESHVLERNKYQTKFPTLEAKQPDPEGVLSGEAELGYVWRDGHAALAQSPRPTDKHIDWWFERAERTAKEITSGDSTIDTQRETLRKVINSAPVAATKKATISTAAGTQYRQDFYAQRNFQKLYNLTIEQPKNRTIRGGVNFENLNISQVYNALYPFGPINRDGGRFVPLNVLLGLTEDLLSEKTTQESIKDDALGKKVKRILRVQAGRNWESGTGYYNRKSTFAFPFNLMSSSVYSGYNKQVIDGTGQNIEIVNLHNDVYGPDSEVPMQGPFTEKYVGGHQSRHVSLNKGTDTYKVRPEGWKLLLGQCADQGPGAVGLATVDYPYPDVGTPPAASSGNVTLGGNISSGDSVTIGDGDTSKVFSVPFENSKSVTFTRNANSYMTIGGNVSGAFGGATRPAPSRCPPGGVSGACDGDIDFFRDPACTISAWISASSNVTSFIYGTGNPHANIDLYTRSNNKLRLNQRWYNGTYSATGSGTVNPYWETDDAVIVPGTWQHIAVTFDARLTASMEVAFFIDGEKVASSIQGTVPTAAGSRLHIDNIAEGLITPSASYQVATLIGGVSTAGVAFTGSIDEPSIWAVSMSAGEVSELYASGSVKDLKTHSLYYSNSSNLHAWYRMGDDSNDALDGTGVYGSPNKIVDQKGINDGNPGPAVNTTFDTNVVSPYSGVGSTIAWTKGASTTDSINNLITAINDSGLKINAVKDPDANAADLNNTKYGISTAKKRSARGSLGNVAIAKAGSTITATGMANGADPKIMNHNAPRATLFREPVAKSPVNIRNIQMKTGSTILGNYRNNYEVVNTVGAFSNPKNFIKKQPIQPLTITSRTNLNRGDINKVQTPSGDVVLNYLARNRTSASHFDLGLDYMATDNSGAFANKTVITSRFGAPGSRETMARGFQDFRSSEFSVYNTIPWRNLTVLEYGTNERAAGAQLVDSGYVVNDIHHRPFGLRQHLQRHNKQFGRDPEAHVGDAGASYDELPAMFKTNRNPLLRIKEIEDGEFVTQSQFDNYWVQHQIPRSDRQYAWITASLVSLNNHFGYLPANYLLSSSTGYAEPYNFVTASDFKSWHWNGNGYWGTTDEFAKESPDFRFAFVPTDFAGINFNLYEPISSSTNIIGYPAGTILFGLLGEVQYRNKTMIFGRGPPASTYPQASAYMFNALMLHRNGPYGWPTWKQIRYDSPITRNEYKTNKISVNSAGSSTGNRKFDLSPVTMRGRPGKINADISRRSTGFTAVATHNNVRLAFREPEADDYFEINYSEKSPFEEVLSVINRNTDMYSPNWYYTAQNLFPSKRNEFLARTRERIGYSDFYSSNINTRVTCGHTISSSFGLRDYSRPRGGVHIVLTQSCWSLDPPSSDVNDGAINWKTRTAAAIGGAGATTTYSDGAGELQNSYVMPKMPDALLNSEGFSDHMLHGLLYSRKHTLGSINSVRSAYGPSITTSPGVKTDGTASVEPLHGQTIGTFAGEALWEAGPQAGINRLNSAGELVFTPYPSEPAMAYSDFKYEPKLMAKDYSILPEFRLSEHIKNLQKLGLAYGAPGWAEIVGTGTNSSGSATFFLDFTNTEFLETHSNLRDGDLEPTEFMLKMDVVKRFKAYKGFYPAQRTQQMVAQFSSSYFNSFMGFFPDMSTSQFTGSYGDELLRRGGTLRPILSSLFAPGVLYNSIKSGMAVDYPILTDLKKAKKFNFIGAGPGSDGEWTKQGDGWALTIDANGLSTGVHDNQGYNGGDFWDLRVPFDGIISPEKYLLDIDVMDSEPHISCSLDVTASLISAPQNNLYSKMTSNFLAETMNFFLENRQPTELVSRVMADSFTFETGSVYTARLKLRRSTAGSRNYAMELDSRGFSHNSHPGIGSEFTSSYGLFGAKNISAPGEAGWIEGQEYQIPQDPIRSVSEASGAFRETFTMYSRPSAFGPPVAALRPETDVNLIKTFEGSRDIKDSFNGFFWSHTAPWTNGEAWFDFIFRPTGDKTYTLPTILQEVKVVQRRFDPGRTGSLCFTGSGNFRPNDGGGNTQLGNLQGIYGMNTNFNAMQFSASINPLGLRRVQAYDGAGETSGILGYQMVVRPHWETPHNNFNSATATMPLYGSASVPKGMWHQYGRIDDEGIYLEIDDIPQTWLRNHYEVIWEDSVYNNYKKLNGKTLYKKNASLVDLLGFRDTGTSVKLGKYAESQTLREAVVAIPYIIEQNENNYTEILDPNLEQYRKKFIDIPKDRWEEAINNPDASGEAVGRSIQKLKKQMEDFILPPQFDFLHNKDLDPIVMFMFEFEYKLDKDDLSYIWQNLAPRSHKQITRETAKIAFELGDDQLMSKENIINNNNLRWMVFKIKQRSQKLYEEYVVSKPGEANRERFLQEAADKESGYKLNYNWPHDYVSFVELARMDAQILYGGRSTGVPGERIQRNLDYTSPILNKPAGTGPGQQEGTPERPAGPATRATPKRTSKRQTKRATKQNSTKKRRTRRMPGSRRGSGGGSGGSGGGKGY